MIIPIFLPHLGCIDRCIYCNQGYITNVLDDDIRSTIKHSLNVNKDAFEIGLYGGNIFNIDPSLLGTLFNYFEPYKERITNFRISTKPVPLKEETIGILKANNVSVIELGMPTFNNGILRKLNRQHTVDEFLTTFHALKNEGFSVAIQVMAGLPEESWSDVITTASNIIQLNPLYIRIYPLVVIADTPLETMYNNGVFVPISFDEALDRAVFIYLTALKNNIKTVKIGLTDNEIIKDKVVAGHYHPAFGYLVRSQAFYLGVKTLIDKHALKGDVIVHLNNRDIPHLVGQRRLNIERFQKTGIMVTWQKENIDEGNFIIESALSKVSGNIFNALDEPSAFSVPVKQPDKGKMIIC
jgi:histone acetyltransferase (RNA polymerase elongator complex component)